MAYNVGTRMGAILGTNDKEIEFFGYGEYLGEIVPDKVNSVGMAKMLADMGITNPAIKLDTGGTVYGAECWWGEEAQIKENIDKAVAAGRTLIHVDVNAWRARVKNEITERPGVDPQK